MNKIVAAGLIIAPLSLGRVNESRRRSEKAARTAPHNPTFTEKPR